MEKQQVLQHSESVFVVLGTQHANCMRSIVLSVACPALQNFTTLYRERRYFQKTLLNLKCVFWFSLQILSETFHIQRRIEQIWPKLYVYWT